MCQIMACMGAIVEKKALGAQDARKDWCKCCDEFSIMCAEEVKNNPRYQGIRMNISHESPPPPIRESK